MSSAKGHLPAGFRLVLDGATRRIDAGRVVIGGSPLRVLRLTAGGQRLVDALVAGADVPPTGGAQRLVRRLLDAGIAHPVPGPSLFPQVDVTVVVPVRDAVDGLAHTLGALGPVAEVIVVDDGSRDARGVAAVVAGHGARLLRHDDSVGPAAARNAGWVLAESPVVAFVDADCVPASGWLPPLLAHLDDPAVAAVAPRITPAGGHGALGAYEAARSPLDLGVRSGPVRPRSWVPYVPTAALVVRRSALVELDGFDGALRYGEDVDLVWRLGDAGWTVRYEPTVEVTHPVRASWPAWVAQRVAYGSAAAPLARRHPRSIAPLVVGAWSAVVWLLAGLGLRKAALSTVAVTTALLVPRLRGLERPAVEAARLAGSGHLRAGRAVADAVRRPWWPLALVAALVSRRARRGVALAVVVPPLVEWARRRPPLDPLRWTALRLVDDIAYGIGVWVGCGRERSLAALCPDLTGFPHAEPARAAAVTDATHR
ncbi:MAG: mycofactocin biosynthesis glycosyltransferase MftF [Acidimicrobiales bacterium]